MEKQRKYFFKNCNWTCFLTENSFWGTVCRVDEEDDLKAKKRSENRWAKAGKHCKKHKENQEKNKRSLW